MSLTSVLIFEHEICVYKFLAHPVGQSLPLIYFLPNSGFQVAMGSRKNTSNKPVTKPSRANLAVYPASSSRTSVHTHPYGTRTKTKTLEEVYAQTLPTLSQNPLYDTFSPIRGLEDSYVAQHVSS